MTANKATRVRMAVKTKVKTAVRMAVKTKVKTAVRMAVRMAPQSPQMGLRAANKGRVRVRVLVRKKRLARPVPWTLIKRRSRSSPPSKVRVKKEARHTASDTTLQRMVLTLGISIPVT
jgi:hypothetical protein